MWRRVRTPRIWRRGIPTAALWTGIEIAALTSPRDANDSKGRLREFYGGQANGRVWHNADHPVAGPEGPTLAMIAYLNLHRPGRVQLLL